MKKRFLITGLNGIVGWNVFCEAQKNHEVVGTYRKEHKDLNQPNMELINTEEPSELEQLFQKINPHYIIHAWSMCDLDICEELPDIPEKVNVDSTRVILEAARKLNDLKKFVYISTDHVFSGEEGPYDEGDAPSPKHVYGKTKARAEQLVSESGLPFMIIRPGLVIGDSLQGNKGPMDFLFTRIRAGKPTHLFTDEWRTPIRVQDLVRRILELTESNETGIFHVAGEKRFSRYDLGLYLAREKGLPTEKIFPRLRKDDKWSHIRPKDLSLISRK